MNHPPDIYGIPHSGCWFSPFNLHYDPMERLLLINFAADPDTLYIGFEPQVFNDPINGQGLLVIAYLHDGRIDVYHQPGLHLEHKNFNIVGKGLADLIERPMTGAYFQITPTGINLDLAFEDKQGRPVAVRIQENSGKPTRPFALLAPMGSSAQNPPALPLVLLYDFYFVRKAGTLFEVRIDGRLHRPDSIPMILDGARVHFVRYAADPFIVTWNEAHNGPLTPLTPQAGQARQDGVVYDLVERDGHPEIQRMRLANDRHELTITFDPPVPDVVCLKAGVQLEGSLTLVCEEASGVISGTYRIVREGAQVHLTIDPAGGWQPNERKWSVRLIYRLAPVFTQWPRSYRWSATIDISDPAQPVMQSRWQRHEQPQTGLRLFR
jgi:hypothetical protein